MIAYSIGYLLVLLTVVGVAFIGPASGASNDTMANARLAFALLCWLLAGLGAGLADPYEAGGWIRLAWWVLFAVIVMQVAARISRAHNTRVQLRPTVAGSVLPGLWTAAFVVAAFGEAWNPSYRLFVGATMAWALWLLGYLGATAMRTRRNRGA